MLNKWYLLNQVLFAETKSYPVAICKMSTLATENANPYDWMGWLFKASDMA